MLDSITHPHVIIISSNKGSFLLKGGAYSVGALIAKLCSYHKALILAGAAKDQ